MVLGGCRSFLLLVTTIMSRSYFYQTLTSDHAKIRKKFALNPVDLKLGNVTI